jgi:hypothetical protein
VVWCLKLTAEARRRGGDEWGIEFFKVAGVGCVIV